MVRMKEGRERGIGDCRLWIAEEGREDQEGKYLTGYTPARRGLRL